MSATTNNDKPTIRPIFALPRKPSTLLNPCGSGSTKVSFLPTISSPFGGLLGSKQYLVKHAWQTSDLETIGETLYRARSMAAHWRQIPKLLSGPVAFGVNPDRVLV